MEVKNNIIANKAARLLYFFTTKKVRIPHNILKNPSPNVKNISIEIPIFETKTLNIHRNGS
jgi:hypothetical protein